MKEKITLLDRLIASIITFLIVGFTVFLVLLLIFRPHGSHVFDEATLSVWLILVISITTVSAFILGFDKTMGLFSHFLGTSLQANKHLTIVLRAVFIGFILITFIIIGPDTDIFTFHRLIQNLK